MNYFEVFVKDGKKARPIFFKSKKALLLVGTGSIIQEATDRELIEPEDLKYVEYAKEISEKEYIKAIGPTFWDENEIQFPRLIAELNAAGVFRSKKLMRTLFLSMDLNHAEIMDIVNRAEKEFEEIKSSV